MRYSGDRSGSLAHVNTALWPGRVKPLSRQNDLFWAHTSIPWPQYRVNRVRKIAEYVCHRIVVLDEALRQRKCRKTVICGRQRDLFQAISLSVGLNRM